LQGVSAYDRTMKIVSLTLDHEAALAAFTGDFHDHGEPDIPGWFPQPGWDHERLVTEVDAWSRGERLQDGWVPCTSLFAEEDGELLGIANVRHHLNDFLRSYGGHVGYGVRPSARGRGVATKLLAASLDLLRELGEEGALLTCAPTNIGSIRVIERNGGVLKDEYEHDQFGMVRRYWITV